MGAFISRQCILQGNRYDLIPGYITKSGGYSTIIAFPKDLLDLPKKCPLCHKGSGLNWIDMHDALIDKRREFMAYSSGIISQRVAKGHSDPYAGFKQVCNAHKEDKPKHKKKVASSGSPALLQYLKKNEVSPEVEQNEPLKEDCDEDYGFPVNRNLLVFCSCMDKYIPPSDDYERGMDWLELKERSKMKRRANRLKVELITSGGDGSGSGDQKKTLESMTMLPPKLV